MYLSVYGNIDAMMNIPAIRAIVSLIAIILLTQCSSDQTRDVILYDFTDHLEQARISHEQHYIDIGTPDSQTALSTGWGSPRNKTGIDYVWAIDTQAEIEIFITDLSIKRLSFACWPFKYPGSPSQAINMFINDRYVNRFELRPEYHTYETELEPGTLVVGVNRIVLRFNYAEAGNKQSEDNPDFRKLAAAFDYFSFGEPQKNNLDSARIAPDKLDNNLRQPAGTEIAYALYLPDQTTLALNTAFYLDTNPETSLSSEVILRRRDGSESILYSSQNDSPDGKQGEIDLSEYSGKLIEIVFRVLGSINDPQTGVIWEQPRLMSSYNAASQTNVILIVVDTLRADYLSSYGGDTPTPNIDKLAASGVTFDNAYSHIPITGPSHASMFTSLLPSQHGVLNNTQILSPRHFTLAEMMQALTYKTAGFISLGTISGIYGMSQGFGIYQDNFIRVGWKTASEVNAEVLPWLSTIGENNFFLFVHYSDPHEPYAAPTGAYSDAEVTLNGSPAGSFPVNGTGVDFELSLKPGVNEVKISAKGGLTFQQINYKGLEVDTQYSQDWQILNFRGKVYEATTAKSGLINFVNNNEETRTLTWKFVASEPVTPELAKRRYAEEVQYVDSEIGILLEALNQNGVLDNTLVVFTSDHGEGLGDHNRIGHVNQLYDTLTKVPLIMSYPGRFSGGKRIQELVSHIDLYPTILDILGIEADLPMEGQSLHGLITGAEEFQPRRVLLETHKSEAPYNLRAIVDGDTKFIRNDTQSTEELYNLHTDPGELTNLLPQELPAATQLRELMDNDFAALILREKYAQDASELTEDEIDKLKALGYLH